MFHKQGNAPPGKSHELICNFAESKQKITETSLADGLLAGS